MATTTIEFTKEEIVARGKEIYERDIRPQVEEGNIGRVVAIDVRTGEFELADDAITSASKLRARLPEAQIYVLRVGYPGLHRILRVLKQRGRRRGNHYEFSVGDQLKLAQHFEE